MKVNGGNYSYPRVGHMETLKAGLPGQFAFVKEGAEYVATKADADRWGFEEGKAYQDWKFPGYPIEIPAGGIEFVGTNFAQEVPHTEIFAVVPGPLVFPAFRFVGCNLVNVTVPDGAEIVGGNLSHGVHAPGDLQRETIFILCECVKCVTAQAILSAGVKDGTLPRDATGRVLHGDPDLKNTFRARRLDSGLVAGDRTASASDNAAAMARVGRTMTASLRTAVGRGT